MAYLAWHWKKSRKVHRDFAGLSAYQVDYLCTVSLLTTALPSPVRFCLS